METSELARRQAKKYFLSCRHKSILKWLNSSLRHVLLTHLPPTLRLPAQFSAAVNLVVYILCLSDHNKKHEQWNMVGTRIKIYVLF